MQLWMLLIVLLTSSYLISENTYDANENFEATQVEAISSSMIVYSNAVGEYSAAYPAYTGSVSDASLTLPSWYRKFSGMNNYVMAGKNYVYYTGMPEVADGLHAKTQSITVGFNRSGILVSPQWGATPIPLPAAIPEGAVVYAK